MKSVIAQGATISKAIDEALVKAGKPQEFFVKILEEGQAGFLGFGSKKAKIALFFKKDEHVRRDSEVLPQNAYKDLFNNDSLDKQLGIEKKEQRPEKKQNFKKRSQENQRPQENKKFERRQLGSDTQKSKQHTAQDNRSESVKGAKKSGFTSRRRPSGQQVKQDDTKQDKREDQPRNSARPNRRRRQGSSNWGANRNNAKKADKPKDSE